MFDIKSLNIFISDDGNGYPSNLLKKIGEPFLNESNFKKNFKLFKKTYRSQIIPFLSNDYSQNELESPINISSDYYIQQETLKNYVRKGGGRVSRNTCVTLVLRGREGI